MKNHYKPYFIVKVMAVLIMLVPFVLFVLGFLLLAFADRSPYSLRVLLCKVGGPLFAMSIPLAALCIPFGLLALFFCDRFCEEGVRGPGKD